MSELFAQVLPVDSASTSEAAAAVSGMTQPISHQNLFSWARLTEGWMDSMINFGIRVVLAIILFAVGCWAIKYIKRFVTSMMIRHKLEGVAISMVSSILVALLYITLGILVAGALGVQSVSFAAILASMGLAVGMALSGQLQNLAGGVIIVLTRPFTIGHFIRAQDVEGVAQAVTLFHTVVTTPENKTIYIPNGVLSNNVITNFNSAGTRRVEWIIGIDYAADVNKALAILTDMVQSNPDILKDPEHFVAVHALAASSVNLIVRAWVKSDDYFPTFFAFNKQVFDEFNKAGIAFPFPQITVSQRKD